MAYYFNGTSNFLRSSSITNFPITSPPISICAWVYPTETVATQETVFQIGDDTITRAFCSLGTNTNQRWSIFTVNSITGSLQFVSTSANNTVVLNKWQFVYGTIQISGTNVTNWKIGYNYTINSVNPTGVTMNSSWERVSIGSRFTGSQQGAYFGPAYIAECAIWNTVLDNDEFYSMADGIKPNKIRPQNLKFYYPLVREAIDVSNARALVASTAAPGVSGDHVRRYG